MGSLPKRKTKLARSTLMRYAREKHYLELDPDDGFPLFMHSRKCMGFCDYGCNWNDGFDVAHDIRIIKGMDMGDTKW